MPRSWWLPLMRLRRHLKDLNRKSGQWLAPVVEIDRHLHSDTDAAGVAAYLAESGQASPCRLGPAETSSGELAQSARHWRGGGRS